MHLLCSINCLFNSTIQNIKDKIKEKEGIPPEKKILLFYKGKTKLEILCEIPRFSQHAMVSGSVAEELAVPKATIVASAIAENSIGADTFEKHLKKIG